MKAAGRRRRWRTYAVACVTTAIVLVFTLAEWSANKFIADRWRLAGTAIEVAIVLLAALAFRPLHKFVEGAVEAAFTKRRRAAHAAIGHLRQELSSFNDAQQVLRRVVEAIDNNMETAGCAIYLRRDLYRAEASSFDVLAESIPLDDPLAIRLRSTAAPAHPHALRSHAAGAIAFPMMAGGDLIGFLSVTEKRHEFEPDDRQLIAVLAEAVGFALIALDPHLRVASAGEVANNLPINLSPLIGREEELAEIAALLEEFRFVTLTGTGGIGKTRTALEVAFHALQRGGDGVWLVDLAPFEEPMLVPSAIAEVVNVADEGGPRPLIDRVAAALKTKRLLIVLDNCEHLIGAAADAVDRLLRTCPGIHILATSREPLGVAGEEVYGVPMLPVPPESDAMTAERVLRYGAAALFVARARAAARDFKLTDENAPIVADLVRRLDGIAMAIELAAPRLRVLSLSQLNQRLDERLKLLSSGSRTAQPRHQTLRALIAWSYDLLGEAEKRLLRQSALFRGSWTLEAAGEVCGDDSFADWDVPELVLALVDKSLVAVEIEGEDQRYRLLESTRQFAAEQLEAGNEREDVAARHCRYFAALGRDAGDAYWQTDSDRWSAQVRRDLENHRAAIGWGLSGDGDAAAAATIVAGLRWLWYASARREGNMLLERATKMLGADAPARIRGSLALCAAVLDNSARAATSAAEAIAALSGGVDDLGRAEALTFEGTALGRAGRADESIAIFDQALAAARATNASRLIGWSLSMMAYWVGAVGDRARARELFDEATELLRAHNDPWQLARLQLHRAEFFFADGDLVNAVACVTEAEAIFRARSADSGLCAATLNAAAYRLALADFDRAWTSAREGLELSLRLDNTITAAWAIGHLAELAAETGDSVRAARLLGYTDSVYRTMSSAREPTEQRGYDRALELIHASLPEDRILTLMSEGATFDRDVASAEAMAITPPQSTTTTASM